MEFIGVYFVIAGTRAIAFKKYPGKSSAMENLKEKYGYVCEKRLILFEGIGQLLCGTLCLLIWFFDKLKYKELSYIMIAFIIFLCISYYPMRKKYLYLK